MILGVDPGPSTSGAVLYAPGARIVTEAHSAMDLDALLELVGAAEHVAIERVQSYGIAGASLLRTSEVVGRVWQAALAMDCTVSLHYRRQVLAALDVTGRGQRDALVRQRLLELHGGSRQAACGTKRAQGPLYGVTGHAWQALAVAVVAVLER